MSQIPEEIAKTIIPLETPIPSAVTFYKVLQIANRALEINASPVDIKQQLMELNKDHIQEAAGQLERTLLSYQVPSSALLI